MPPVRALLGLDDTRDDALGQFVSERLFDAVVWPSPRTSDGVIYVRLAEHVLQTVGSRSDGFCDRPPSICGANAGAAERVEGIGFDSAVAWLAVGRPVRVAEVEMVRCGPGHAEEAAMDERVVTRAHDRKGRWIVGAALRARQDVMNFQMFA